MKLIYLALMLFSSSALAGSGGAYDTTTCTSASGRTVVTLTQDMSLESSDLVITLIVDGQPVTYTSKDESLSIAGNSEGVRVEKRLEGLDSVVFGLVGSGSQRRALVYEDPRKGTFAQVNAKEDLQLIDVSCKTFSQQP